MIKSHPYPLTTTQTKSTARSREEATHKLSTQMRKRQKAAEH